MIEAMQKKPQCMRQIVDTRFTGLVGFEGWKNMTDDAIYNHDIIITNGKISLAAQPGLPPGLQDYAVLY